MGSATVNVTLNGAAGGLDDRALADRCRAGEEGAFDLLVERHRRRVYQVCYRFTGNHEDAADLSQEVFLRAYRGLPRFKGDASLATWIYRIAVNACLNRVSAGKVARTPIDGAARLADARPHAIDVLIDAERTALVRAAIAQLPPKQRATLVLRVYHELPHQQIAEIVGTSVGAAKANLFHALRNLKRLIEGGGEPGGSQR